MTRDRDELPAWGGFSGTLDTQVRQERGCADAIFSRFWECEVPGPFINESGAWSDVTRGALQLIKDIVGRHGSGPDSDEADPEATRSSLLRAYARAFEAPGGHLGLPADMSRCGFPADHIARREGIVRDMAAERIRGLGLGDRVVVDRESRPVSDEGA